MMNSDINPYTLDQQDLVRHEPWEAPNWIQLKPENAKTDYLQSSLMQLIIAQIARIITLLHITFFVNLPCCISANLLF